jgi:ABC-type multidrug transport system ATPase subunit
VNTDARGQSSGRGPVGGEPAVMTIASGPADGQPAAAASDSGSVSPDLAAVELDDVSLHIGQATAVEELSYTVKPGSVVGLLGHNGAGKTTTLRLIAGVLTASAGRLRVFGLDPVTQGPQVRRHTGVLLSDPPVDRRLTGRENLQFTARLYALSRAVAAERIDELAVSFHLDDRLDELVERYSDGMRQRLALARVLLPNPSLLLLDEPTASLDPMAAHGVRQLVRDLALSHTRTVILATHDLIEASELCDHVVVLERGRLVAHGTPAELVDRVAARALRLLVADLDRARVSVLAAGLGYTVEPLETGVLCVHGVDYDDVPALVRTLAGAGVALYGVDIDRPTLTDVYLALHRAEEGLADAP